jgi:hypothetical protein
MKNCAAHVVVGLMSVVLCLAQLTVGQTSTQTASALPRLIRFGGTLQDPKGNPLSGVTGITFALYSEQTGGAALWLETQNVTADSNGHYTVLLGATTSQGLPVSIFSSEQAHWVGVQVSGQAEQPRVLLVSAPYALKAGDAETVGGLPPAAFMLATPGTTNSAGPGGLSPALNPGAKVGGSGTQDYIPIWTDNSGDLGNSILYQSGTGSGGRIGVNLTQPLATLDLNGTELVRGLFEMATTGLASSTKAYNSQPFNLESSAFNSGTGKYALNHFQWQAEPTGNNTTAPAATLNLLYGTDPNQPGETGLKISNTGLFTFAAGQTFPGTGTITGVTAGPGLTGGGNNGNVSLSVPGGGITNAMLQNSAVTVAAGTDLTGGGAVSLGGSTTLNLDTTKVPQLTGSNTFTGNETMNGTLTISSTSTYQPFLVQTSSTFGTWLELSNTSTGGQTWDILSAASGNAEGAGNLGITNLHGGTIWLEGPVNVSGTLHASGNASPTTTAQGAYLGWNALSGSTGETDFINNQGGGSGGFAFMNTPSSGSPRTTLMFIKGAGNVGIGTTSPANQLDVFAQTATANAINGVGFPGSTGTVGVVGTGGVGAQIGGDGVQGFGGFGVVEADGSGGSFAGASAAGMDGDGVDGIAGSGSAGNFTGNVFVSGTLLAGNKQFKIDHPLDPANKYLAHSSVESSEMMNIYTGNITTDTHGEATVRLPEWFEVLNTDFRYQLTVIGQFAQAIVASEIENHQFRIRTNLPNVKVSWQVTGVRQDVYAKANPLVVEEDKARLRGFYIHPELYGAPAERQIEWARHPQLMKKVQEMRARQQAGARASAPVTRAQPLAR